MVGFCSYHQLSRWGINSPPGVVKELQGGQVNLKKSSRVDTFCIRKNHLLHIGKFCSLIINLHILNMSQSVVNGYNYMVTRISLYKYLIL